MLKCPAIALLFVVAVWATIASWVIRHQSAKQAAKELSIDLDCIEFHRNLLASEEFLSIFCPVAAR